MSELHHSNIIFLLNILFRVLNIDADAGCLILKSHLSCNADFASVHALNALKDHVEEDLLKLHLIASHTHGQVLSQILLHVNVLLD